LEDLSDSEPGDQQQGNEQDSASREQLLPQLAPLNHHQRQHTQLSAETHDASPRCSEEEGPDGKNRE